MSLNTSSWPQQWFEFETAPHFGGLWEAAVKSAKQISVRQIANASLTESEVPTVLAEEEAIQNSTPLSPASTDPNDGEVLTPGHLLIGQAFCSLPQSSNVHSLQRRSKCQTTEPNIEVGAMVVVHEVQTPPQRWITGEGPDGRARVAEVRTGAGFIKRPIHKLAHLTSD
ncbi:GL15630 [Drosophila persimilis]|uniref:GL15630 n=1 Tax=Drosophila persimilis TaxID=7234 RepID=B4HAS0_DROPE|nr:GL15630 [Drosophila persimilis]